MAQGSALVFQVLSGDSIQLCGKAQPGRQPPMLQLTLSGCQAPRMATRTTEDAPCAFEAREFLRSKLIGKSVQFKQEYTKQEGARERIFGQVFFEDKNMNVELIKAGYAKAVITKEGEKSISNAEDLQNAENEAKTAKVGMWATDVSKTARVVESLQDDGFNMTKFIAENKGKKRSCIVDFIQTGGAIRVCFLPTDYDNRHINALVMMSGIMGVPHPSKRNEKGEEVPEPYALECKHWVSERILCRQLDIQIEDVNITYKTLTGSVLHPKGNIGPMLLEEGFAKVQDATARNCVAGLKGMYAAMRKAQAAKKRLWKNFQGQLSEGALEFSGKVVEVVSGDQVFILNPETGVEKRFFLASLRANRLNVAGKGSKKVQGKVVVVREDEVMAFEAKEFLRLKCSGRKVRVKEEFRKHVQDFMPRDKEGQVIKSAITASGNPLPPTSDDEGNMIFISMSLVGSDNLNLNEELVKEGLVEIDMRGGNDAPRAGNIADLQELQEIAKQNKKGLWGLTDTERATKKANQGSKANHFIDLVGPDNTNRAKAYENSLCRGAEYVAMVDHVFKGSRFKLRVPAENIFVSFYCNGIRCPETARPNVPSSFNEPYAWEAVQFARHNVLQQNVKVKFQACDRGGNFRGKLVRDKKDFAESLLAEGLAWCDEFTETGPYKEIELIAQKAKKNVWSIAETEEEKAKKEAVKSALVGKKLGPVEVVHINSVSSIFVQETNSAELKKLNQLLKDCNPGSLEDADGKKGEVCLAKWGSDYHRVRVINRSKGTFSIYFVDYGNTDETSRLKKIPPTLTLDKLPAQCVEIALMGVHPDTKGNEVNAGCFLQKETDGAKFFAYMEQAAENGKYKAFLLPYPGDKPPSVNQNILKAGWARIDKKSKPQCVTYSALDEACRHARDRNIGMWVYGDVFDSDEEGGADWY